MGWCGYFALADTKSVFRELDGWIRRRLTYVSMEELEETKDKDTATSFD